MRATVLIATLLFTQIFGYSQESQNTEVEKLSSGKFTVHKVIEKSRNNFKFETASKPWPVEFKKEGNGYSEILVKRAGIIDENYTADLKKYPAYYSNSASEIVVSVINKKIYYYKWSIKSGAEIVYVLSEKSVTNYDTEKSILDDYRRNVITKQSSAREERVEERNELAAKEKAENTLEGKTIQSIKVMLVEDPGDIGLLTIVQIGIEVTLTDGTVLKTKNLGGKTPYSDFEFEVSGGDYAGGDFKVANDSREIPNDRIEVSAKSKFGSSGIKGELSHPINYKSEIFYQYQGKSGSLGRPNTVGISKHGGDGTDGRSVTISADLQQINGHSVNEITIRDSNTGELLAKSKLNVDSKITVNVNGGYGGNGADGDYASNHDGGDGGNGGDAGTVLLSGSGASSLDITVLMNGGKGGRGGKGKTVADNDGTNGSSGSNGSFIK